MKEEEFHKTIEEQNPDHKKILFEKICSRIDIESQPKTEKRRKIFSLKWVCIAAASICLLCVAIILPLALQNNDDVPADPNRYCSQEDYVYSLVDYTIKDYGLTHGKDIKFFDWYDFADDFQTSVYLNKNDKNDLICIEESIVNGETGDIVTLFVTDNRTKVDFLEWYTDSCKRTQEINGVTIMWEITTSYALAKFEYFGFRYYIQLDEPLSDTSMLDLAAELIR